MSTRDDATLTEAERAAFARLQAQAIADDPSLGAPMSWRAGQAAKAIAKVAGRIGTRAYAGPLLMLVGIAAVAIGLAASVAISMAGLVLIVLGAIPVTERITARIDGPPVEPPVPPAS